MGINPLLSGKQSATSEKNAKNGVFELNVHTSCSSLIKKRFCISAGYRGGDLMKGIDGEVQNIKKSVSGGKKGDFRGGDFMKVLMEKLKKIKMSVGGGKKEEFLNIIDLLC